MRRFHLRSVVCKGVCTWALLAPSISLFAKDKHPQPKQNSAQDQIETVSRIPVSDGPISRFLVTTHFRRSYLYAEHQSGGSATLIDITDIHQPTVLGTATYPVNSENHLVVA